MFESMTPELEMTKQKFKFEANIHPKKFIGVNMRHQLPTFEEETLSRKQLYIELDYKCGVFSEVLRNHPNRSIRRTFTAASYAHPLLPSGTLWINCHI